MRANAALMNARKASKDFKRRRARCKETRDGALAALRFAREPVEVVADATYQARRDEVTKTQRVTLRDIESAARSATANHANASLDRPRGLAR